MAIPDFQSLMRPLLQFASDQHEHRFSEAVEAMARQFELTEAERKTVIPSGRQPLITNRTAWAKSYLTMAGLLSAPQRGVMRITDEGLRVLSNGPERITLGFLKRYPGVAVARSERSSAQSSVTADVARSEEATPEETLLDGVQRLLGALEAELLSRLRSGSPAFFEQVVIDVLVAAGYGGSAADAGEVLGRSGDGGIDGIIKEDRLGLDRIYLQAKRWEDIVGRPKIQEFVGALQGKRARKGVFVTTSDFTKEAREYAEGVESRVVLINGSELARMMVEFDVGCAPHRTLVIKRVDGDYFEES